MPLPAPFIVFDLEGPLSSNDSVLELMQSLGCGDHLLQILNRYDDLLSMEGGKSYEVGSAAALAAPFLIVHGLSVNRLLRLADKAGIIPGARELVDALRSRGWQVHCVTAAYLPYVRRLAQKLGLAPENVWGTVFPLDYYKKMLSPKTRDLVRQVEREAADLRPYQDDQEIRRILDDLFSTSQWGLGWLLQELRPMVGARKLLTLRALAMAHRLTLGEVVAVGDSIADRAMLEGVNKGEGLAIAFNASEHALRRATVGLASTNVLDLLPVLEAWTDGGRRSVMEALRKKESTFGEADRDNFHWVRGKTLPIEIHSRIRALVRPGVADLS